MKTHLISSDADDLYPPILAHPEFKRQFLFDEDASDNAVALFGIYACSVTRTAMHVARVRYIGKLNHL